ncbi:YifB family Mg chelatase-like AAA ATPase [Pseudobacteroides cellulosolvens]|uniref:Mg chelatase, subunit ChlI n=1 Tax=Pseudobacteroides cellulosolvens ATCC 35603 = DSM 2933 TaxID=398512 RepID=A0A0L6JRS7_9FIRM|nr:YifB family Mg chelatase-like AAA ATPase [Pseudobacteroides cellulosolvens]KNY28395.1 Mg chelatase, subunit ChlI [Pseudobacteroides cellulosolvens ATCC 35603 = DSM 2933]
MISRIKSCGLVGIDGYVVEIETDISNGIPAFDIVGLGDAAVRESKERVRTSIKNSKMDFPVRRITVNLSPASVRKEGSHFDLGIALGILSATGQINTSEIHNYMFIGELSLDGQVKPVTGVLPMAVQAKDEGIENIILSIDNAQEAAVVKGVNVLPVKSIVDVINHLNKTARIEPYTIDIDSLFLNNIEYEFDFSDVKGQENVKRALEVAASGAHNCILIGSPGSGKTMIAKRIPSILPSMTFEESLQVTKIHSIAGTLPPKTPLMTKRPFRSPHHTISHYSLVGGGKIPKPGEISLAHFGVLFLDEVPEFSKEALEVMRQPLEDGYVNISRLSGSISYPSKTMLICAGNPCRCGNFLDDSKQCSCSPRQIQQYLGKISGPLLDRIDIHIEVAGVQYQDLDNPVCGEKSHVIRERVNKARKRQLERYIGLEIFSNSQLTPALINKFCKLDYEGKELLKNAFERLGLSARAHNRILKVARTIADMDESDDIKVQHLAEAIQYRSLDRKFWGR